METQTTTINPTIINQYKLNAKLFNNVLVDITDEEANKRISDSTNIIHN